MVRTFTWKKILAMSAGLIIAAGASIGYHLTNQVNDVVQGLSTQGSVVDLLTPEALAGESTGVVNILVAGNSSDDVGHSGADLTDSIMVASYNLQTNKTALISIPRDLWVSVNGYSMKLNAVYTIGGMDLLDSEVEEILGITINHHVLLHYTAFQNIVDAIGGVDITIESSDLRGIYDPMIGFTIANGAQHLTGEQALKLVRSRNDPTYDGRIAYGLPNGDFDRANNQRKIVTAVMDKISSGSTLTNLTTVTGLIKSLSGSVETNMTVGQLRRVYDLSKEVASTSSTSIRGSNADVLLTDSTISGQSVLMPRSGMESYGLIRAFIAAQLAETAQ